MDAARMLKELSEPCSREEKITTIIERTARLAGLSYSRCYELWYGRARRIEHAEWLRLREALDKKNQKDARHELSELRIRLTRLESLLVLSDSDFHRPTIDLVGKQVRRPR